MSENCLELFLLLSHIGVCAGWGGGGGGGALLHMTCIKTCLHGTFSWLSQARGGMVTNDWFIMIKLKLLPKA